MNEVDVEEGLGSSDSIGWIALSTFFGEVAELPVDDGVVSLAIEVKQVSENDAKGVNVEGF